MGELAVAQRISGPGAVQLRKPKQQPQYRGDCTMEETLKRRDHLCASFMKYSNVAPSSSGTI